MEFHLYSVTRLNHRYILSQMIMTLCDQWVILGSEGSPCDYISGERLTIWIIMDKGVKDCGRPLLPGERWEGHLREFESDQALLFQYSRGPGDDSSQDP